MVALVSLLPRDEEVSLELFYSKAPCSVCTVTYVSGRTAGWIRGAMRRIMADISWVCGDMVGSGKTILLVDDDESVRALVRQFLEIKGYTVLDAREAGAAAKLCRANAGAIELLITDISMPETSGVELARQLGQIRPDLKVLYISGYTDMQGTSRTEPLGRTEFLQKPFTIDTLTAKVAGLIGA